MKCLRPPPSGGEPAQPDEVPSAAPVQTSQEPDAVQKKEPAQTDEMPSAAPVQTSQEPDAVQKKEPAQPDEMSSAAPVQTSQESDAAQKKEPAQTDEMPSAASVQFSQEPDAVQNKEPAQPDEMPSAAPVQPERGTGVDIAGLAARIKQYDIYSAEIIQVSEEEFVDPANAVGIKKRLADIVRQEAPISENMLISRLLCSVALDMSAQKAVGYCRRLIEEHGFIRSSNAGNIFVWAQGMIPGGCVSLRINGSGDAARRAEDIPVEEAANAAYIILSECKAVDRDIVVRECAELMGLADDAAALRLFDDAVTYAVRVRNMELTDDGKLRLTRNGSYRADAVRSNNLDQGKGGK